MNKLIGIKPSLWKLVAKLKEEANTLERVIELLKAGHGKERKRKYIDHDKRLEHMWDDFDKDNNIIHLLSHGAEMIKLDNIHQTDEDNIDEMADVEQDDIY